MDTAAVFAACTFVSQFIAFVASMFHILLNIIYPPFDLVPGITQESITTFCTAVAAGSAT